jgi:hypothetical protein
MSIAHSPDAIRDVNLLIDPESLANGADDVKVHLIDFDWAVRWTRHVLDGDQQDNGKATGRGSGRAAYYQGA